MSDASPVSTPSAARARREPDLPAVERRYLLLTFVPMWIDRDGAVWLERLWHHDLLEHLRYLRRLTLCAPRCEKGAGPDDLVRVEVPAGASLETVALPKLETMGGSLRAVPRMTATLYRAIGEHDIVHSGVAGWPLPPGWIANSIALVRGRALVLVVESAPWRLSTGEETRRRRARALVTEALARFFVRRADLTVFTHPEYQRTLGGADAASVVLPASWINDEDILDLEGARQKWERARERSVSLLFAARLVREKGVRVLLAALDELDTAGVPARVTIIGEGPERAACVEAAARLRVVRLTVLDPVPYGEPFFALLDRHEGVLVTNLADEQPRIVFDASARAVPVIATDTAGLLPHVDHDVTGWIVPRARVDALAAAIARATGDAAALARLGLAAHARAPSFTHRGMHRARWRVLVERFGAG